MRDVLVNVLGKPRLTQTSMSMSGVDVFFPGAMHSDIVHTATCLMSVTDCSDAWVY